MHVNRILFLVSVSKHIHYGTAQALESMKIPKMEMVIKSIISSYKVRGFHVAILHVDIQFKAIRDRKLLGDVTTNVVSRGEHVPEIERLNRVLKERARCYFAMLPYKTMPRMMVIHKFKAR